MPEMVFISVTRSDTGEVVSVNSEMLGNLGPINYYRQFGTNRVVMIREDSLALAFLKHQELERMRNAPKKEMFEVPL